MKKILVTGFDPFDNEKINPALEVIKLLPKKIGENEIRILEIPTVYRKSIEKIDKEIESYDPDYILSMRKGWYFNRKNCNKYRWF